MAKFEIEYYRTIITDKVIVEGITDYGAIKEFREDNLYNGIKSVKYVYEGNEEPKEWYCRWWNGNDWKSKVVLAHDRNEIIYNLKDTLDYAVYDFDCCLNTPEAVDKLIRSWID